MLRIRTDVPAGATVVTVVRSVVVTGLSLESTLKSYEYKTYFLSLSQNELIKSLNMNNADKDSRLGIQLDMDMSPYDLDTLVNNLRRKQNQQADIESDTRCISSRESSIKG